MTSIFIAESRRLVARRSFRIIGALCIFGVLLGGLIVFLQSSKDPNSGLRQAQALVADCQAHLGSPAFPKGGPGSGLRVVGQCPTVAQVLPQFDKRFRYAEALPSTTQNIAIPLFFLAFAVAASFVGAEFGTGMMTTTLTWEPRRGRVLIGKAIPALVTLGAAVVVLLAFMAVAYIPIGMLRGTTAGMTAGFWQHLAGLWLRAGLVAVFGASLGVGLATLARSTVAALGVGFVYMAILDQIASQLWSRRFAPWLLSRNLAIAMHMPITVFRQETAFGGHSTTDVLMSSTRPAILLSIYGLALLGVAYAAFRSRDVT